MTAAKLQSINRPVPAGSSVRSLPLAALRAAPWNARQSFDGQAQEELVASIRQHGVLVALIVRPIPMTDSFEVVAGHRRLLAGGVLKLEEMPCDVRSLSDEQAREIGLVDNLQRADLSALEEAEAFQQMFELAGTAGRKLTPADVAAKVGRTEAHVRLRLRLLSADAGVRDALREGAIVLGHAQELARLAPGVQKQLLEWLLFRPAYGSGKPAKRQEVPSLGELKQHIGEEIMLDLAQAPFDTKSAELVPAAGACVDCPKRTGNNKLLFADVKQGDLCTDPPCFAAKVTRGIDVAIEQLTAKGEKAVRISDEYQRSAQTPKDALVGQQFRPTHGAGKCDDYAIGIYVHGWRRGQREHVCLAKDCRVHSMHSQSSNPDNAARRKKARLEKECRVRIFKAALVATEKRTVASDAQLRALVAYAVDRGYNNGVVSLLNILEWPKAMAQHGGRKQLLAKLATVTVGRAAAIGLLASVAHTLTVNEYSISRPELLEEVAKGFGVDVAKIRKEVAAESAEKAAKKKPAKKAPTKEVRKKRSVLSGEARARIAVAQKRRWAKLPKAGRK